MTHFFKYQALGNDFILCDQITLPEQLIGDQRWICTVKKICDRHQGVGADGILLIDPATLASAPKVYVFNADGSYGQFSGNGVRCAAMHLMRHHHYPQNFVMQMGERQIAAELLQQKGNSASIATALPSGVYHGVESAVISAGTFSGHLVDVGNPHLIFFQPVERAWLVAHGKELEYYKGPGQATNVEFVWRNDILTQELRMLVVDLLVFERGVGITMACSSGAAAITWLLHARGEIVAGQHIGVHMLGGMVEGWVDEAEQIHLAAEAEYVFEGDLALNLFFP